MFFTLLKAILLQPGPRYKWSKVVLILITTMMISGLAVGLLWYYYKTVRPSILSKNSDAIQAIIQISRSSSYVDGIFLAEVMGLSVDKPASLDLVEAEAKLLKTSLFKKVHLKIPKPHFLLVDYEMRVPIAFLGDYTNTLMDDEGAFFPASPFYSPRLLPEIRLGSPFSSLPWEEKMESHPLAIVSEILKMLGKRADMRIDLSDAQKPSAGQRQIIVSLGTKRILRLTLKNYPQELSRYLILEKTILKQDPSSYVVDLRVSDMAYIQKV